MASVRIDKPWSYIPSIRFSSLCVNCCYSAIWYLQGTYYVFAFLPLLESIPDSIYRMRQLLLLSLITLTAYHLNHCACKLNHFRISQISTTPVIRTWPRTLLHGVAIWILINAFSIYWHCATFRIASSYIRSDYFYWDYLKLNLTNHLSVKDLFLNMVINTIYNILL